MGSLRISATKEVLKMNKCFWFAIIIWIVVGILNTFNPDGRTVVIWLAILNIIILSVGLQHPIKRGK